MIFSFQGITFDVTVRTVIDEIERPGSLLEMRVTVNPPVQGTSLFCAFDDNADARIEPVAGTLQDAALRSDFSFRAPLPESGYDKVEFSFLVRSGIRPVRTTTQTIYFKDTDVLVADTSIEFPAFLMPFHLETRIVNQSLRIRVFPDQMAINKHQEKITKQEMTDGDFYISNANKTAAWQYLCEKYTPARAAWIVAVASAERIGPYPFASPKQFIYPLINILPNFFLLTLYLSNGMVIRKRGKKILAPLAVIAPSETEGMLSGKARWLSDFNVALDNGMAFSLDLAGFAGAPRVDRMTVVGIRHESKAVPNALALSELFKAHHYSTGIGFLKYGTPTNNTEQGDSAYSTSDTGKDRHDPQYQGTSLNVNAQRLGHALGMPAETFAKWENNEEMSPQEVERWHEALWPATGQYFLENFLTGLVPETAQSRLKVQFEKFVRPLGWLPTIRIGKNPYGILPVTQFRTREQIGWISSATDYGIKPENVAWAKFDTQFQKILEKLAEKWLASANSDKVPKIPGASQNMSMDELISAILCMAPSNCGYGVRAFFEEKMLDFLLLFGYYSSDDMRRYARVSLEGVLYANRQQFRSTVRTLSGILPADDLLLKKIFSIGDVEKDPMPLVRGNGENNQPENYLQHLLGSGAQANYSETLLYKMLYRSKRLKGKVLNPNQALAAGQDPEDLFKGILDTFAYRLDPWISSLANKRLAGMRTANAQGIVLGGYGFIENLSLTAAGTTVPDGGFIHAPSPSQAATAAILKSAYDYSANNANQNESRINISSDRIRRALDILEGIRNGQELGALLGYLFERMLHDGGKNEYKDEFRKAFTFGKPGGTSADILTKKTPGPRLVVNGLKLINSPAPPHIQQIIDREEVIRNALFHLRDTLDAVSDLTLHESVFQIVNGNYERGGSVLGTSTGNVIEPESVSVKLSRKEIEHRICIVLDASVEATAANLSPREKADRVVAAWFAGILGPLNDVGCSVQFYQKSADTIEHKQRTVTLSDIAISAVDFMYISSVRPGGTESELAGYITQFLRKNIPNLVEDTDHPVEIDLSRYDENAAVPDPRAKGYARSMEDASELAHQVLHTLAQMPYLRPENLCRKSTSTQNAESPQSFSFTGADVIQLKDRANEAATSLNALVQELDAIYLPIPLQAKYGRVLDSVLSVLNDLARTTERYQEASGIRDAIVNGIISQNQSFTAFTEVLPGSALMSDVLPLITAEVVSDITKIPAIAADVTSLLRKLLLPLYRHELQHLAPITEKIGAIEDVLSAFAAVNEYCGDQCLGIIPGLRQHGFDIAFHQKVSPAVISQLLEAAGKKQHRAKTLIESIPLDLAQGSGPANNKYIEILVQAMKAIFGERFIALPVMSVPDAANVQRAMDKQQTILCGKTTDRIYLWMQQVAQTHRPVAQLEDLLLLTDAWTPVTNAARLKPYIVPQPLTGTGNLPRWQALSNEELGVKSINDRFEPVKSSLGICWFTDRNFTGAGMPGAVAGFVVDEWVEALPHGKVDTAIAFEADTPNQQAPNCCLLAVPSQRKETLWSLRDLEAIVYDTLDLAKIRAVDLEAQPDLKGLFPSIYMPFDAGQDFAPAKKLPFAFEDLATAL